MLGKTIEFEDFNGNKRKETFWFHLSKAETIEWLTTNGDYTLDQLILRLSEKRNGKEVMAIFKDLIYRSYGEKSLDGRKFVKTEEVKSEFMDTEAFSVLFTELVMDGNKAAEFINGILPKDFTEEIGKVLRDNPEGIPDEMKDYLLSTGPTVVQ